jgi:hypothetical protein
MYWLSADSTDRRPAEPWADYSQRSCSEVLSKFERLVSEADFVKEVVNWRFDATAVQTLVFVADFVTKSEFAELSTMRNK